MVLKNPSFGDAVDLATKSVACIKASSSKWGNVHTCITAFQLFNCVQRLKDLIDSIYMHYVYPIGVCKNRWNSIQMCLSSILRVKSACGVIFPTFRRSRFSKRARMLWGTSVLEYYCRSDWSFDR